MSVAPSTGGREELAKAASATLARLNTTMSQMTGWRIERLTLASQVQRLKSALKRSGESPDATLKPDPLVVHQRVEISRLELTVDRLEAEVLGLREALRESEQAVTCSGAKRLKEKMAKAREDGRILKDEIEHLKLRVEEAEAESSCAPLISRLRAKLREILNGDKKMDRIIADVASRSCGTVIDLGNELKRAKELMDESRRKYIRAEGESTRLKAALESGYLETIEQLERKIKEFVDELGDKEAAVEALKNEIIGAKTAFKIKSQELEASRGEFEALEEVVKQRDLLLADLEERLKGAGIQRLKAELVSLGIERDAAVVRAENMREIVAERNEHIVRILEVNEDRERARNAEIEEMRNRLYASRADNEMRKVRCERLEDEMSKLNVLGRSAAGGEERSATLVKKIKELEEELERLLAQKDPPDFGSGVETSGCQVREVKGWKARLGEGENLPDKIGIRNAEPRNEVCENNRQIGEFHANYLTAERELGVEIGA